MYFILNSPTQIKHSTPVSHPKRFATACLRKWGTPRLARKCDAFPPSGLKNSQESRKKQNSFGLNPILWRFPAEVGVTAAGKLG
jgi:hypothetical protein